MIFWSAGQTGRSKGLGDKYDRSTSVSPEIPASAGSKMTTPLKVYRPSRWLDWREASVVSLEVI
jgi:hypothetical protein